MPELFRKRPVVIEAMRVTAHAAELATLEEWFIEHDAPAQIVTAWDNTTRTMHVSVHIETLEGELSADKGNWIIRGVAGEFYPCEPDIFERTYEPVTTSELPAYAADAGEQLAFTRGYRQGHDDAIDECRPHIDQLKAEVEAWRSAAYGAANQAIRLRETLLALDIRMRHAADLQAETLTELGVAAASTLQLADHLKAPIEATIATAVAHADAWQALLGAATPQEDGDA